MNILFVSSQFPNACEPNRGIFSQQIVKELVGFAQVQVVAPVPTLGAMKFLDSFKRYRTDFAIAENVTVDALTVHHPRYFAMPRMGFLHPVSMRRALDPLIRKIHRDWRIDAVNCHWVFPDGVAVQKICEELAIPVMLTPLGTDLNRYLKYPLRKEAIRRALVRASAVSVLSRGMHECCLALGVGPERLQLIPNGVDLEKFSPRERSACRKELSIEEGAQTILFVGGLVPVKGVDTLLRAFALLKKRGRATSRTLYLAGSGFLEQDLKRLARTLKISDQVVFTGAVSHQGLAVWMNAADCLCLPSLSEGHPNVVMEALACGLPVVASAVGSVPDYVIPGTGYTVTPGDPEELAEKLDSCLCATFVRERIRAQVETMSWRNCAQSYYEALRTLTA